MPVWLRNEPPCQALRMQRLQLDVADMADEDVAALMADLAAHSSLRELDLVSAPLDILAALDAVVDACG